MSKHSRAERRHHRKRILAKCIRQAWHGPYTDRSWVIWWARKRVNARTLCSCSTCGTPRRHYGNSAVALSLQELRAVDWQKEID